MSSQLTCICIRNFLPAIILSIDLGISCLVAEITTLDLGDNLPHFLGVGQLSRLQVISLYYRVIQVHHEGDARCHRPGTEFREILSYRMLNTWNIGQLSCTL